ncbi:cupin domain-containing protein [Undibacterium sp. TS12]|uniref:cupin domain-containing protein n=1 Tax=Undibacterium sp. TS12 TaxID=2908202 RepID=UPI001F4C58F5|nr:cupin domain-containing protein [Undibacterium sp. TS12]MCH8622189.1 cupin domain-containing protein [Undibacterium sp. TS12]
MKLNSDLSQRVIIQSADLPWVDSPASGVQRKMLERHGEEVARATSIVRYAAGSQFPLHVHDLGEEIFVLDGVFEDEHGGYGPGMYIKNPPGSTHAPGSSTGCTLFVKLRHLDPDDSETVRIDINTSNWLPGLVPGLSVMPLSEFEAQHTALVRWAPGTRFKPHRHFGGEEIFVLEGMFEDEFGQYPAGTWMRSPHMSAHHPFSTRGCLILVKTGHLLQSQTPDTSLELNT